MNYKKIYTREQLFSDLNKEVIGEKNGLENLDSFQPVELKYLISLLEACDSSEEVPFELNKPFSDLLYTFSLFVSSHPDYRYNKGYLNGCIKEFPDFVVKCALFFNRVLNHFNFVIQSVPINLCSNYIIAYDDILHFRYIHDEEVWCCYLNPDKINRFFAINIDKIHFELLGDNYAPIFVLSISGEKEESVIMEIVYFLEKHHL